MKTFNISFFIVWFLFYSCTNIKHKANNVTNVNKEFYKNGTAALETKTQLDSFIAKINRGLEKIGSKIVPVIISQTQDGDSTIYQVEFQSRTINNKMIGQPLPDFNFKDLDGKMVHLSQLKGKPIIINLWFVECPPCIAEMPALNSIKDRYSNSDIQFLSMTYETKESVRKFLEKIKINYRIIPGIGKYIDILASNFPQTIFVNRQGIITEIQNGMIPIYDKKQKRNSDKMDETDFIAALDSIK